MKRLRVVVALGAAFFAGHAYAECAPAEILRPPPDVTIHEARPEIVWTALPGVKLYRVQIESRVPEGEVIERVDTRVSDTRFVPPRRLADRRVAVKVLVTSDCPESTSIATRTARFTIDLAPLCQSVQGLAVSGAGVPKVQWVRASGATRYEVEAYSFAEGSLLMRKETTLTSLDLPRGDKPLIIAVRPRCESIFGEPSFAYLPDSR